MPPFVWRLLKVRLFNHRNRDLLCRKLLKGLNLKWTVWVPILCHLWLDISIFYKDGVRQREFWTFMNITP